MMYDVAIIGGGVSGSALLHMLDKYTDLEKIALFEKYDSPAQVASHHTQNSQTLHFGDIETNYSVEQASLVSQGARLVQKYLDAHDPKLVPSCSRMSRGDAWIAVTLQAQ